MNKQEDRPSQLLWMIKKDYPHASNPQLADIFMEKFPKVRSSAKRVIWRWRGGGNEQNYFCDDQIDELLGEILRDAGYF